MRPDLVRAVARAAAPVLALAALAALAWALATGRIVPPPRWNPWAPLDIAEAPGWFTRLKLDRLAAAPPAACYAWLDAAGVRHAPLADRDGNDGCGWRGATRLSGFGEVRLSSPAPLTCPAAVALALWERHALQPAAFVQLGARVRTVEHLGSYACRDIEGGRPGRRSEHARANALDVSAFRLTDGRTVGVASGWAPDGANGRGSAAALFLAEAHRGACAFFPGVLGPEYNAAHRDHFHLDRGPYRVCR